MSANQTEIKVTGYGGQGVILSGYIIGRAATIFDNKNATMTQSFGPEARGSACSISLIISPQPIYYPYITAPNILVAMSPDGFQKFYPELAGDGIMVVEEDLVKVKEVGKKQKLFTCPVTRMAEELGKRLVMNVVMLGFFTAVTDVVSREAMRQSISASVPAGTEELNLMAFEKGYAHFQETKKEVAT